MIEQRCNFIGGEGVSKGEMGWDPPLVEPPTKRYKPIVDYVSLTTFAFEAAMRWCRKSGMLAECQRSYHGEYFLPKTLLLTEFLAKKQPQSPNGQKLFYMPSTAKPKTPKFRSLSQVIAKNSIMQCAVLVKVYYVYQIF